MKENQKTVLEHLKKMCPLELDMYPMVTIHCLMDDIINDNWQYYSDEKPEVIKLSEALGRKEQAEILHAFSAWILSED